MKTMRTWWTTMKKQFLFFSFRTLFERTCNKQINNLLVTPHMIAMVDKKAPTQQSILWAKSKRPPKWTTLKTYIHKYIIYDYICVCLFFVYIFFARVKSHFLGCQENMWTCENNTKARASHSDMLDEGTCRFTDVEAFIDPDKFQGVAQ